MKRFFKGICLLLLLILPINLVACGGGKEDTRPVAKGFVWKAIKGEKEVILVGTMHPAPTTHNLFNETLVEVLNNTDKLWLEIDQTNKGFGEKVKELSYLKEGESISDFLSTEEISKLEEILKELGGDLKSVEGLTAYGISSVVNALSTKESNFTGQTLDYLLTTSARKYGYSVNEIEGVDMQLDITKKLYSLEALKESLSKWDGVKDEVDTTYIDNIFEAYVNGDIIFPTDQVKKQKENDLEVYNMLQTDRNIKMVERIDNELESTVKNTIAVGYMHFMGDDSILKLLEAKGYTITQL